MLDWGALVNGGNEEKTPETGEILGHCPKRAPRFSDGLGHAKSSNDAASGGNTPNAPNAPSKKQGEDKEATKTDAAGAAAPSDFCAQYPVNPAAVFLAFAWLEKIGGDMEELGDLVSGLRSMEPGEQVKAWAYSCRDVGIDPWRAIHLQSSGEGQECYNCKHLVTRVDSLPHTRCRYFWCCDLHYQVFEHYQGGRRVVIAPPECKSWEHWKAEHKPPMVNESVNKEGNDERN